jgi:Zn-finger nucleic acid-binding protein
MNCPICNIPLLLSEKQGIEIDYCQKCRGIWLDRGELEKIIERSNSFEPQHSDNGFSHVDKDYHSRNKDEHHYGKKKKSFFTELFD